MCVVNTGRSWKGYSISVGTCAGSYYSGAARVGRDNRSMAMLRRIHLPKLLLGIHGFIFIWSELTQQWKNWGEFGLIYTYAGFIPFQLASAWALWRASGRVDLPAGSRRALQYFSASFGVLALGSLTLLIIAVDAHGNEPRYNYSDFFYVLIYPLQVIALLYLPRTSANPLPASRKWLDFGVLLLAAAILTAAQLELLGEWKGWSLVLAGAYPNLAVLGLLAANRAIAYGLPLPSRRAWRMLLTTVTVSLLADIFFQTMWATGYSGPNWSVPAGVAINLAMLLAADWCRLDPIESGGDPTAAVPYTPLPLLMTAGAAVVLLLLAWTGNLSVVRLLLAALLVLNLVVLVREFIMVMDSIRLVRQQTAREGERRFEAMIRHSSDLILVVDAALKVRFASPAAGPLLGCSPESLFAKNLETLVPPGESSRLNAVLNAIMLSPRGGTQTLNIGFRHQDGSERKLECQVTNLLEEPAVRGVVLNARDLTERSLLEERLRQSQKMEVVGQLAGGVAHDFNNLLTAVLGGSELALTELPPGHPARRDLEGIRVAAQRGAALTKRLLAFSRSGSAGVTAQRAASRVESVHILLQRLLRDAQTISLKLEPDTGVITVDPESFEHSLLNLVANARDAIDTRGAVTITVGNRTLSGQLNSVYLSAPAGDYVLVEVADTGTGMTPATLGRIFQPFFTTKSPGRGTGLGLAGVYSFMRECGGGITVDSAPGTGTRVGLWFPRADSTAVPFPTAAAAVRPQAVSGRILLVEDDAVVRATAARILQMRGYTLFVAEGPEQARQLFTEQQAQFDLVISDVIMPGESGAALTVWMRKIRPDLRVLLISGYPGEELTRLGLQPGGVELLRKPFTIQELTDNITRVMAENPATGK